MVGNAKDGFLNQKTNSPVARAALQEKILLFDFAGCANF